MQDSRRKYNENSNRVRHVEMECVNENSEDELFN